MKIFISVLSHRNEKMSTILQEKLEILSSHNSKSLEPMNIHGKQVNKTKSSKEISMA